MTLVVLTRDARDVLDRDEPAVAYLCGFCGRGYTRSMPFLAHLALEQEQHRTMTRPTVGAVEARNRPAAGATETRDLPAESLRVEGRTLHGVVPYGVESRDLGGFREIIERGAFAAADMTDLVAVTNHDDRSIPLGRYGNTLTVEDREDGLHWSVELPESRNDLAEAVRRGDITGGSWRMVVGRDRYEGDVRHVEEVRQLLDVGPVSRPAYSAARVELRSTNGARPAGSLRVEDRRAAAGLPRDLAEAFRSQGFPGERAMLDWRSYEQRAASLVAGSLDDLAPQRVDGVALGADTRWLYPVLPSVALEAGTTSVDVLRQKSRTLADPATMIRAIDATTQKPETDSQLEVVAVQPNQVASVESGVPNIYLESPAVNAMINGDLRLALSEALDKLAVDAIEALTAHQDPTTDGLVIAIRKAISTMQAAGYAPDVLALDPASAEELDTLKFMQGTDQVGWQNGGPGRFAAPVWGLRHRISKALAAPVVLDSSAVGRLYVAPVSLARFEENAGGTNTSLVRMETNAVAAVERADAAVRIAAA